MKVKGLKLQSLTNKLLIRFPYIHIVKPLKSELIGAVFCSDFNLFGLAESCWFGYLIEENGSLSILEKLKKVTIKDVAESWQNTSVNLLRRSWKKLWPSLKFEKTPTQNLNLSKKKTRSDFPGIRISGV